MRQKISADFNFRQLLLNSRNKIKNTTEENEQKKICF